MTSLRPLRAVALPDFRVPKAGMSLTVIPPFPFEGMTVRSFPLRANVNALQRFCDAYLNFIPPELGRFRAMAPYVQLLLVDYGKMATKVRNVGWIAQREVLFSIPLEWYKVKDGKWEFHDWASIAPFIYVDDDMSMATGRTVYGWPKTIGRLTPTLSEWMRDPLAPVTDATVSTMVFPELYSGRELESRVFLEVKNAGPMATFAFPPDVKGPLAPWSIAAHLAEAMAGFSRDSVGMLNAAGIWPLHESTTPENYAAMMGKVSEMGFLPKPNLVSNTINLKQFRKSERPDEYCYQAVTNGPIRFTGFNRAGLLGEQHVLAGDTSGGYSITLHQWPSLPIVETLGLEVSERWRGDGCDVVKLKPVMPFWYDVDMEYMRGENVAWRERDGIWHDGAGRAYPNVVTTGMDDKAQTAQQAVDEAIDATETDLLFNTTLGASQMAVAGPFTFSDTTIRVLPLLAERRVLQQFLDTFMNGALEPGGHRFCVWGPADESDPFAYVYLTVSNFGDVTSPTNNIGDWAKFELQYLVPVQREELMPDGTWQVHGVGLVPALTLVDNATAAAANSEVLGIPTEHATFVEPESVWLKSGGTMPEAWQALLKVKAEVSPAIGEGQKTVVRQILEITEGIVPDDVQGHGWRATADRWAAMLRQELHRKKLVKASKRSELKHARALALNLLANRSPISLFTLKQIRDVSDPMRACYQSVVRVHRTLRDVLDIREIEQPLLVRMHEYPTSPIKSLLGLVAKPLAEQSAGILWALQPIRPFWILATVEESLGERVLFQSGETGWTKSDPAVASYFSSTDATGVSPTVNAIQDRGDPRRLAKALTDVNVLRRTSGQFARDLEREEARDAIRVIDPQMVIDTMLSREWGNWDEQARWRRGLRDLDAQLAMYLAGVPEDQLNAAEKQFYEDAADELEQRPGRERSSDAQDAAMTEQRREFELAREEAEARWAKIARGMREAPLDSELTSLRGDFKAFKDAITKIAGMEIVGETASPDARPNYSPHDARMRLQELAEHAFDAATQSTDALREACMEAIKLCRDRSALQRQALLNRLAKGWQKPDFTIRRDSAGPDRERLFPRAESWDDEWYAGPPVRRPDEPSRKSKATRKQ